MYPCIHNYLCSKQTRQRKQCKEKKDTGKQQFIYND